MPKEMLLVEWSGKVYTGMNRKQLARDPIFRGSLCKFSISQSGLSIGNVKNVLSELCR